MACATRLIQGSDELITDTLSGRPICFSIGPILKNTAITWLSRCGPQAPSKTEHSLFCTHTNRSSRTLPHRFHRRVDRVALSVKFNFKMPSGIVPMSRSRHRFDVPSCHHNVNCTSLEEALGYPHPESPIPHPHLRAKSRSRAAHRRQSISNSRSCTGGRAKCQVNPERIAPWRTSSSASTEWKSRTEYTCAAVVSFPAESEVAKPLLHLSDRALDLFLQRLQAGIAIAHDPFGIAASAARFGAARNYE